MKRMMLGVILMGLALSACSGKTDTPSPTPSVVTPTATASPSPTVFEPPKLESLIIAPGGVGPLEVGMPVAEALATQVAVKQPETDDGCELSELAWLDSYKNALDVWVGEDGKVVSIGVFKPGPRTAEGLGVGSTLADVSKVYDDAEMGEFGYDQSGVVVSDGDRWLGFLFDETLDEVNRKSIVSFVEVTNDRKPSLMRVGC